MAQTGRPHLMEAAFIEHHLYTTYTHLIVVKPIDSGSLSWLGHLPST